jgi:hypothetical protein
MGIHQPDINHAHRCVGKQALTSMNVVATARAQYVYTTDMQLSATDQLIVTLVGRFKHLTTNHIKRLVYPGKDGNPQRKAIDRLLNNKLLARVNQRLPGGARGGSQMYVYQLGTLGRKIFSGRRGHSTVVDYHALAIADVYVELFEADRRGEIKLLNWATEPDCHIDFGGIHLEPDLYIDVVTSRDGETIRHPRWIEVDLGTEHKKQMTEKLTAYKLAYETRNDYPLPIYPTTLYLVTRDERAAELRYWMRYLKDLPATVLEVAKLADVLHILQQ